MVTLRNYLQIWKNLIIKILNFSIPLLLIGLFCFMIGSYVELLGLSIFLFIMMGICYCLLYFIWQEENTIRQEFDNSKEGKILLLRKRIGLIKREQRRYNKIIPWDIDSKISELKAEIKRATKEMNENGKDYEDEISLEYYEELSPGRTGIITRDEMIDFYKSKYKKALRRKEKAEQELEPYLQMSDEEKMENWREHLQKNREYDKQVEELENQIKQIEKS